MGIDNVRLDRLYRLLGYELGARQVHLTPEIMRQCYGLLRVTLPFRRWKLPHPRDVEFYALPMRDAQGHCLPFTDGSFRVTVDPSRHHAIPSVLLTLAHEMCHMRQELLKRSTKHGPFFQKLADQVCRHHTYMDRGQF